MRKIVLTLVVLNILLVFLNVVKNVAYTNDYPLTEKDIPPLTVISENPKIGYSAHRATGASSCYTIGPYYSENTAHSLAGSIRKYGLEVTIRSMRTKETLNYLVYIPNIQSKQKAQGIVKDLWKHNVDNGKIVKNGPHKNTITLGFFKTLDKAKRQTEYVRYLGYDARYSGRKIVKRVYWIDYDEPLGTGTPVLMWSDELSPDANPQIIPRTCDQRAWYGKEAFADASPESSEDGAE